jgi:predicted methyltransferase
MFARGKSFRSFLLIVLLPGLIAIAMRVWTNASSAPPPPQAAPAQSPTQDKDRINRQTSPPYTGDLAIFEDPERDKKLQIDRVMDLLHIQPGSVVADIGAGSGWFSVRAARRVGSTGHVYAEDINAAYLDYIRNRVRQEKLANVQAILGKSDDPLLPPDSLDAVLLMKTYHEIAEPILLLRHLHAAMHAGARLGIIDRNGKGDDHGLDRGVVIEEARRAGFKLVGDYDFVKPDGVDYFLIFQPSPIAAQRRHVLPSGSPGTLSPSHPIYSDRDSSDQQAVVEPNTGQAIGTDGTATHTLGALHDVRSALSGLALLLFVYLLVFAKSS